MNNYDGLIHIKYNSFSLKFIIVLILIITIFIINVIKIYDTYEVIGELNLNNLTLKIPTINSDIIEKGKFIKIDNEIVSYKIIEKSLSYYNETIEYQNIKLHMNKGYDANTYKVITFYYNEETIMQKIKHIVF